MRKRTLYLGLTGAVGAGDCAAAKERVQPSKKPTRPRHAAARGDQCEMDMARVR